MSRNFWNDGWIFATGQPTALQVGTWYNLPFQLLLQSHSEFRWNLCPQ